MLPSSLVYPAEPVEPVEPPPSPVYPVAPVEQENPRQFEEWQVKRYNEMFNSRSLSKEDVVFLVGILKECT